MKLLTAIVIIAGGLLVLASYLYGMLMYPDKASAMWGGVPRNLRPLYTFSMLPAAASYLYFTWFWLFRAAHLGMAVDFRLLVGIYALILVPSSLWMPLTIRMVTQPLPGTWLAIRLVLALVALGALAMLLLLVAGRPRPADWSYWVAIVGGVIFLLHTAVLDAFLWPRLFQ